MKLSEKQKRFAVALGHLFEYIRRKRGYEFTLGRGHVPGARVKSGKFSCHHYKLAQDLNLFIDGKYQRKTAAYRELGDIWEALGGDWGGDFSDGNHFSFKHGGVK